MDRGLKQVAGTALKSGRNNLSGMAVFFAGAGFLNKVRLIQHLDVCLRLKAVRPIY